MKESKTETKKVLLIGIGNSGREDDGIGWKFAEMIEDLGYDFLDCEFRYQLQIEDAAMMINREMVIFVDASHTLLKNGFEMKPCMAINSYFFSSHAQSPEAILYLANNLYNSFPKTYTLAIMGQQWELKTALSKEAEKNLQSAFSFFVQDFLAATRAQELV